LELIEGYAENTGALKKVEVEQMDDTVPLRGAHGTGRATQQAAPLPHLQPC
jgi:hypothetical protein